MPASGCRVTFFFSDDVYGFSETHNYLAASQISAAINPAKALLKKRLKICGFGVTPVGVRLSMEGVFRDSQVLSADDLAGLAPATGTYQDSNGVAQPNDSDQPKACVRVRAESGTLHRKSIFLAGVPDVIIRENPRGPAVAQIPQWEKDFKLYVKELLNGWGFVARSAENGNLTRRQVTAVQTQVGTALIGLSTPSVGQAYTVGQKVQVRNFTRKNVAYASINGTWQVDSVVADSPVAGFTTYYLRNSSLVAASTILNMGTIQLVDYSTWAYDDVQLQGQTTRKRGNRFLAGPGRRSVRKLLTF